MFEYDVCVVGLGRVGLPLALAFDNAGLKVFGIDLNEKILKSIEHKEMPFKEKGCQELLEKSNLTVSNEYDENVFKCENIVICIGTPILKNREIDFSYLKNVLDSLIPYIQIDQNIILRSTVKPLLSERIKEYIESEKNMKCGYDFYFSFCPERLAEGKALEEIQNLPQIIGCEDDKSFYKSSILFSKIVKKESLKTTLLNAELSKVFLNMSRYAYFGIVNYLTILADTYNSNIHEILEISNNNYPRPILFGPGLTAGTCLVKDWRMPDADTMYSSFFETIDSINQNIIQYFLPDIESCVIKDESIGILGYTFKANSDDTRDSIVPNIIRYFENRFYKKIMIHDSNVNIEDVPEEHCKYFKSFDEVKKADVLIIAVNHDEYKNHIYSNEVVFDIWNITKKNKIIQYN
jgi:UDP-N-acetyl-D-mannosaminuronic acid dehydrogenase